MVASANLRAPCSSSLLILTCSLALRLPCLVSEFTGYATDITRSYPINGQFTADQRMVHEADIDAQRQVIAGMPGVFYSSMHRLAECMIVKHLLLAGMMRHGSVDELMAANICSFFLPQIRPHAQQELT